MTCQTMPLSKIRTNATNNFDELFIWTHINKHYTNSTIIKKIINTIITMYGLSISVILNEPTNLNPIVCSFCVEKIKCERNSSWHVNSKCVDTILVNVVGRWIVRRRYCALIAASCKRIGFLIKQTETIVKNMLVHAQVFVC